jgi:hypothetical protein
MGMAVCGAVPLLAAVAIAAVLGRREGTAATLRVGRAAAA